MLEYWSNGFFKPILHHSTTPLLRLGVILWLNPWDFIPTRRSASAAKPANCLEVCPTNAIVRTEFDTVVIQSDACNGCRDCISACPFGVIEINPASGTAQKCTLCYDRLQGGLEPACSKACPTQSIQFGTINDLKGRAQKRVEQLHQAGEKRAYLYGADEKMLGGLNSFYLLVDKPEVYGLPPDPKMPTRNLASGSWFSVLGAVLVGLMGVINFRNRGARLDNPEERP